MKRVADDALAPLEPVGRARGGLKAGHARGKMIVTVVDVGKEVHRHD
jgi:hypothetical protein